MTYPAPMICPYDEWFSEPIMTETQMEYMKLYSVREEDDIVVNMDGGVGGSWRVELEKDEHAIDEEVVDCDEMDSPSYIGVPDLLT